VEIESTRPLSARKRWRVVRVLRRASAAAAEAVAGIEPAGGIEAAAQGGQIAGTEE
jgi:hypothetical protein